MSRLEFTLPLVDVERRILSERLVAQRALERPLARVPPPVRLQRPRAGKPRAADVADVRLLPGVSLPVDLQRGLEAVALAAQLAAEALLLGVDQGVLHQLLPQVEGLVAHGAHVGLHRRVDHRVGPQQLLGPVRPAADLADVETGRGGGGGG